MKKNLIGAVAAGLALAFAFTACESGNDNPIRIPTDADAAVYEKKTFDYVNTPSSYSSQSHAGIVLAENTEYATGGVGSWTWLGYDATGTNKWNRDVAKDTDTSGTVYTSNRGTVTGDTIGDVVKTRKNTFTVNTVDNTWKLVAESTNKEVFGIYVWDYDTTTSGSTTVFSNTKAEYSYASRKKVPFKLLVSGTSYPAGIPAFTVTNAVVGGTTQSSVTPGAVYYGGAGGLTEDVVRDNTIAQLKSAVEAQEKFVARLKDNPDGNKSDIEAAELRLKEVKAYYDNSRAWREGATYVVDESTTVDGVTNGSVTYYTAKGGTVVYKIVTKDAGTKSEKTGTYKLLQGNYVTGQLLLTKVEKVTFDTNANNVGYYINEGNNNDRGKTEEDYPVASTSKAGAVLQYNGRLVDIVSGKLQGHEAVTTTILTTVATGYVRDNYLGWNYQTYKAAQDDRDTTARTYSDRYKTLQTYTLKQ